MHFQTKHLAVAAGLLVIVITCVWVIIELNNEKTRLVDELSYTQTQVNDLAELVSKKEEEVEVHKELLRIFRQQSAAAEYDFSAMRSMVEQATETVEDIKKLEEADGELLAKYSKVYFLNEHYEPQNLTYIPDDFVLSQERNLEIKDDVLPFLENMFLAMKGDGLAPRIISAYRSFGYQEQLKHNHSVTYGTSVSNQFVADQGYSEHQLGTTVDIVNTSIGSDMSAFDATAEYQWLLNHAHEYGFILSYPESNAYYAFEPWHWRFVGKELAGVLHTQGTFFYDLPQRDINTYRIKMFDN